VIAPLVTTIRTCFIAVIPQRDDLQIALDFTAVQRGAERVRNMLLDLRQRFDLSPFEYSKQVRIAPTELPYSHPRITLNTWVRDDLGLLSSNGLVTIGLAVDFIGTAKVARRGERRHQNRQHDLLRAEPHQGRRLRCRARQRDLPRGAEARMTALEIMPRRNANGSIL